MRLFLVAFIAALTTACAGIAVMARYDLGSSPAGSEAGLLLRSVDVHSPSWLASPAMQYRYAPASRREAYAEARWVAPPGELLEGLLKRRLLVDEKRIQAVGCSLRVDIGEFVQAFAAPGTSRAVLEINATLVAPRSDILLSRHAFSRSRPAGADARAGAAAFATASAQLADDVAAWLADLARDAPEVVLRCNARYPG